MMKNNGWGVLFFYLLILTTSCEEEEISVDVPPAQIRFNDGYFVARAGDDRSILTGDTVILKAIFANNQRNNSFRWRFVSKPENSQVSPLDFDQSTITFRADQPGIYKLELSMFFEENITVDTVKVSAFTISNLQGKYSYPEKGASATVRQFMVFQDRLYAAGDFSEIGGIKSNGLARFDGSEWVPFDQGFQVDQVHQIIEFQGRLYASGTARQLGADDIIKFASWNGKFWEGLTSAEDGGQMEVFQAKLYMNVGDQLAVWDGTNLIFKETPDRGTITFLKAIGNKLYVRGFKSQSCTNSTENVWVYNCNAKGYFFQFNGYDWERFEINGHPDCLNLDDISWDYHVWIDSEPNFKWTLFSGDENRQYFPCGSSEDGKFQEFSYPLETIHSMEVKDSRDLYISGRNQLSKYSGLMKWDGTRWFSLGEGIEGQIYTHQWYHGKLYIGGSFEIAAGEVQINFTVWEGS